MLILGRRAEQSIVFPTCGITVRLLNVNGRVAKIGIEAPEQVTILRGEVAGHYGEEPPSRDAADRLSRLRDQLLEVQSLRDRGFDDRADRLFERVLLELNAIDRAKKSAVIVSEVAADYQPGISTRVLFVGSPSTEYEDDVHLIQRRTSSFSLMADCMTVDFFVRASQYDCIIFDLESCGPHVATRIKELRSNAASCPRILCISQYAPSIYGLSLMNPAFDGWLWKPWDHETALSHIRFALGYITQES